MQGIITPIKLKPSFIEPNSKFDSFFFNSTEFQPSLRDFLDISWAYWEGMEGHMSDQSIHEAGADRYEVLREIYI